MWDICWVRLWSVNGKHKTLSKETRGMHGIHREWRRTNKSQRKACDLGTDSGLKQPFPSHWKRLDFQPTFPPAPPGSHLLSMSHFGTGRCECKRTLVTWEMFAKLFNSLLDTLEQVHFFPIHLGPRDQRKLQKKSYLKMACKSISLWPKALVPPLTSPLGGVGWRLVGREGWRGGGDGHKTEYILSFLTESKTGRNTGG